MSMEASATLAPPTVGRNEGVAGERVEEFLVVTVVKRPQTSPHSATPLNRWGGLPLIGLTSACGLLLVALAFNGGRAMARWTDLPLWLGLILLFVPCAARLLSPHASRTERLGIVTLFGVALYLVKVFQYPLFFSYHDELIHWRTADDILRYGRLFQPNPLIPVSPLFPGLEIVTTALVELSGLSIFQAGVLVIGVARVVLALALYLFYERVSGSAQVGGIATLLYMSNPKLLFFDAQFSYESLALPFAVLTLFVVLRRRPGGGDSWSALTVVAALGLGALVLSHHLTAYALIAFFALWSAILVILRLRGGGRGQADPTGLMVLGGLLCLIWLVYVASLVVGYLAPHIVGSITEFTELLRGDIVSRTLFKDSTGQVTPAWERAAALAATLLIVLGLPLGLLEVWRCHRWNAPVLALAVAGATFPVTLAFRLTQAGGELSDRAAVTLFIAVAALLALGVVRLLTLGAWRRPITALCLALLTIFFLGEIVVGAGPTWTRVPGPYLVGGDSRSIEPQGLAAARWARAELGPDNRFATDRTNRLLLVSEGGQYPVTHLSDRVDIAPLFLTAGYGPTQDALVHAGDIRYVLIDRRISEALPRVGVYYEANEAGAYRHTAPIALAGLVKFNRLLNVSLLYDSGSIQIYALGEGVREP